MHEKQQRINAVNELSFGDFAAQSQRQHLQQQQILDHQLIQPIIHTYPSGTTITSIDGLPILKRKRGRPPKNKSVEVNIKTLS